MLMSQNATRGYGALRTNEQPELVDQCKANALWMRTELERMGFNCLASETAVVPIVIGPVEQMLWFNQRIFEEGVFANPVLPPAVPHPSIGPPQAAGLPPAFRASNPDPP